MVSVAFAEEWRSRRPEQPNLCEHERGPHGGMPSDPERMAEMRVRSMAPARRLAGAIDLTRMLTDILDFAKEDVLLPRHTRLLVQLVDEGASFVAMNRS